MLIHEEEKIVKTLKSLIIFNFGQPDTEIFEMFMWILLVVGAAPKGQGHFLSPDSLARGVFLAKIPEPRVYFSSEFLS